MSSASGFNLDQSNCFPKQAPVFTCLQCRSLENTVGKGEIARNEQFLVFPQRFLPCSYILHSYFNQYLILSSANTFSLEESEFVA